MGLTTCATVGCHNEAGEYGAKCPQCRKRDLNTP